MGSILFGFSLSEEMMGFYVLSDCNWPKIMVLLIWFGQDFCKNKTNKRKKKNSWKQTLSIEICVKDVDYGKQKDEISLNA